MKKGLIILFIFCLIHHIPFDVYPQKPTSFSCQATHSQKTGLGNPAIQDIRSEQIDIERISIFLDFSDWNAREMYGYADIHIQSKTNHLEDIELDLLKLTVDSVVSDGQQLTFSYNDTLLTATFSSPIQSEEAKIVRIYYQGHPYQNPADWGGFYWNSAYAYNIGVSFLEDPHNYGRVWFPCFDNFVERSLYDYHITTQSSQKAFCGGVLIDSTDHGDGTTTWNWKCNQEIPSYLASVAIADYATVYDIYEGLERDIPIQLAARASDTANLRASFIHLKEGVRAFEESYGPYLFDRIGYSIVPFTAGAMEHAMNIAYMRYAINQGNTEWETLMAHELSHHWWGDLVTCNEAEDMWLNEGWASYSESLFLEYVYGKEAYKDYVRENHDYVHRLLHVDDGGFYPVSGVSHDLTYSSTVYDKGADMAHTIRGVLGDDVFFSCIRSFMDTYSFTDIHSDLLEEYLSDCSGMNLSNFFETWIKEKGHRHFSIDNYDIEESNDGTYLVKGTILQKVKETSKYSNLLPIPITVFDEAWNQETFSVYITGECSSFQLSLNYPPVYIALDLEEKISDATVDKYLVVDSAQSTDFGLARLVLDIDSIFEDSALIRVVHNYIHADPIKHPSSQQNTLHISNERYWDIEGIHVNSMTAKATFRYDGTTNTTNGYLDNLLITNSEDSLTILYRANSDSDWALVDSFVLNPEGSVNDKRGRIEVFNVQSGQYVLGIYDSNKTDSTQARESCIYTSIDFAEKMEKLVHIYPVPSEDYIRIEFLIPNIEIDKINVYNLLGSTIHSNRIRRQNHIEISTIDWKSGTYIISFYNKENEVYSNLFIKE